MRPYGNFYTLLFSDFFQEYLLRIRTDKRQEIFNKISKHCLNNYKSHQRAKNGYCTFVNKATAAEKL